MNTREHNGVMVIGETREAVDHYIRNDDKIRAGLCPNGCGSLSARDFGQVCERCKFSCNTPRETVQSTSRCVS